MAGFAALTGFCRTALFAGLDAFGATFFGADLTLFFGILRLGFFTFLAGAGLFLGEAVLRAAGFAAFFLLVFVAMVSLRAPWLAFVD